MYPAHSPTLTVNLEPAICMCSHRYIRITQHASDSYFETPSPSNDRDSEPSTPAFFKSEDQIPAEQHVELWKGMPTNVHRLYKAGKHK